MVKKETKVLIMNKFFFSLLLLINVIYIADFLMEFNLFPFGPLWLVIFIFSFILSTTYLLRSRKAAHYNPLLSIALLVTSFSCIGTYFFQYFLANLMGWYLVTKKNLSVFRKVLFLGSFLINCYFWFISVKSLHWQVDWSARYETPRKWKSHFLRAM